MDRDTLIQQVKDEYARLADMEGQAHIHNHTYSNTSPEAYYEQKLQTVIRDIENGKYDDFSNGLELVEWVAKHKNKSERIRDTIESTIHNMELAQAQIAQTPSDKTAGELLEQNERRAQAVTSMIREMKEQQALEKLESGSSDIIGGGK